MSQPVSPPPPSRRSRGNVVLLLVLGALALVAAATTAGVLLFQSGPARITVATVSYDLDVPGSGTLVFDVTKPQDRTVVCTVRGRTFDNEVAGREAGITIPPSSMDTVRTSTTVTLTKKAVIMEVEQCLLLPVGASSAG